MKRRTLLACITFSMQLYAGAQLLTILPEGAQTLISQLKSIPLPESSLLLQSSKDVAKPLMKELATKLNNVRSQYKGKVRLQDKKIHTALVLKAVLSELYKNPLLHQRSWHLLSSLEKNQTFFEPAWRSVLELNPGAIKDALRILFFNNTKLLAFIDKIRSFSDQNYLKELAKKDETKQLMTELFVVSQENVALKPEIMNQLKRGNLMLASIAVLDDIAKRFFIFEKKTVLTPKGEWADTALWVPYDKSGKQLIDPSTLNEMILQTYSVFMLRDWFKSPGLAPERFSNWYFFPSVLTKPFPKMNEVYTPLNLNSAEVVDQGTVFYRSEVLSKNAIHELFHAIQIESGISINSSSDFIKKNFAISRTDGSPCLLTETVVETITIIVYTMLYASMLGQDSESFFSRLQELWQWQKKFVFYKAAQLLFINNFSSTAEFLQPQKTNHRIRETTAAAEYLLFKAAFIFEPERFLAILKLPIAEKQKRLQSLLLEVMKNPDFQKEIDFYLNWIKKHQESSKLFNTGKLVLF